jgi:pyrroline-5-carboxylate reductase
MARALTTAARASIATPNTLNMQMVEGLAQAGAFDSLPAILTRISDSMCVS